MEVNQFNSIQIKSFGRKFCTWFAIRPLELMRATGKQQLIFRDYISRSLLLAPLSSVQTQCFFFGIEFNEYYNDHISFPVFARFECIFMQKMWWTIFARQYFSSCQFQKKTHELNPERNSIDVIFFNIKCITIPWNVYNILQIIDIKLSIKLLFQSIMWKSFGNSLKLVSISPHFITNRKLHFHQAKKKTEFKKSAFVFYVDRIFFFVYVSVLKHFHWWALPCPIDSRSLWFLKTDINMSVYSVNVKREWAVVVTERECVLRFHISIPKREQKWSENYSIKQKSV